MESASNFLKIWIGAYIIIYAFPFPLYYIPALNDVFDLLIFDHLDAFTLWIGKVILGLSELEKIEMTGSGDTTFDYVALATYSFIALLIAGIHTLFFNKKPPKFNLFQMSLIYARYFVGITLIQYGIVKFLEGQFPSLSLLDLETTYGASSPMGLGWRFFMYSTLYKAFMGFSEITAGFLLMFRRAHVIGAMIAIAVCINIVLVNFSFDVPVKLFSLHLLVFSILILIPHLNGLFQFFIFQKQSKLELYSLPRLSKKWQVGSGAIKVLVIGLLPLSFTYDHLMNQSNYIFLNEWEGVYTVSDFQSLSENELSAESHYNKVILSKMSLVIYKGQNANKYYISEISSNGELEFFESESEDRKYKLKIKEEDLPMYSLQFSFGNNVYVAKAERKVKSDYLLLNRGFHWINEYPFNR